MNIRLIIFDFDGTLGDTQRNIVMTLQQTMQQLQLPVADEKACVATIGLTLSDSFKRLFPHLTDKQANECTENYRCIFDENKKSLVPELFPHVSETLRQLNEKGINLTVASSRSSNSLYDFLRDMGIVDYFRYIVGAEEVNNPKPDPEPVFLTLRALNAKPEETLVVGDMPVDMMMGKRAGAFTCGVTYGNAGRTQLEETGADFIIDDMAELMGIVVLMFILSKHCFILIISL